MSNTEQRVAALAGQAMGTQVLLDLKDKLIKAHKELPFRDDLTDLGREIEDENQINKLLDKAIHGTLETIEGLFEIQVRYQLPGEEEIITPVTKLSQMYWEAVNN